MGSRESVANELSLSYRLLSLSFPGAIAILVWFSQRQNQCLVAARSSRRCGYFGSFGFSNQTRHAICQSSEICPSLSLIVGFMLGCCLSAQPSFLSFQLYYTKSLHINISKKSYTFARLPVEK